jgi:hypothetical protein
MFSVTQDYYISSNNRMILNNESERTRKEARLVLVLDKRSAYLEKYEHVIVAIIGHLWYTFKWYISTRRSFIFAYINGNTSNILWSYTSTLLTCLHGMVLNKAL